MKDFDHRLGKPPVLETCTLIQAARWIAFKRPPLSATHERLECYEDFTLECPDGNDVIHWVDLGVVSKADALLEIQEIAGKFIKATNLIQKALAYNQLHATGTAHLSDYGFSIDGNRVHEGERVQVPTEGEFSISDDWKYNVIYVGPLVFADVQISFSELKELFPHTEQNLGYNAVISVNVPPKMKFMAVSDPDFTSDSDITTSSLSVNMTQYQSLYTTKLLTVLDSLRDKMTSDPDPTTWTRDAIQTEAMAYSPGISGNDAKAIATVLLSDANRGK